MQNEKKLVVLFPGFGYGPDKPLLYYAAKVARRQGLDCMVVQYSQLFPHEETPQASAAKSYPGAAQDAMTQIPAGYDRLYNIKQHLSRHLVHKKFGCLKKQVVR